MAEKATTDTNPFEAFTTMNPEMFKDGYEKFAEGVSTVADFNKGVIEASMASAGAFSQGLEKLASEQTAFVKSAYENGVEAAKSAAAAKSVHEAFDVQSEYARTAIEQNLGQANKVANLWADTTKQTFAPLTERYSELVEKIQSYRP